MTPEPGPRFQILPAHHLPPRADGLGTTAEVCIPHEARPSPLLWITGFRAAGSTSGRHYHKGISPAKSPEVFILLQGRGRWRIADIQSNTTNPTLQEFPIEAPCTVVIHPRIWHELIADTDLTFIELNSMADHAPDTFTDWQPNQP